MILRTVRPPEGFEPGPVPPPGPVRTVPPQAGRGLSWLKIFLAGLLLWVASLVVTLLTANANLVPTLILLGSFLVPVTFVAWSFEHWRDEHVTAELVVKAFVAGGVLGVLGASLLETYLLHPSPLLFVGVGLIEEAVKLAALVYITRRLPHHHTRDGIVLGAAVGFGFAAFESAGYAFNALLTVHGLSLNALVETEVIRGLLAPVGHGLWTAILGGFLFRASREGPFRYSGGLLAAFLWVSLLHALWDSMNEIAVVVTFLLTGTPWQYRLLEYGYMPQPTNEQVHLFTVLSNSGLALVSVLGITTLLLTWRGARE
ncbi:MAG: Membrane proteinase PrsW, cleaves anti-sigma factor RsiW, family [Actinomycetia bacterium]|nr:Membrane proteinase PrsW, cleaves anti-sigma factor RsiW, family [Actinomycetes bacterium]